MKAFSRAVRSVGGKDGYAMVKEEIRNRFESTDLRKRRCGWNDPAPTPEMDVYDMIAQRRGFLGRHANPFTASSFILT
jgi:hypothetical protein